MIFRGGKFLINTIYMRNSDRPAGMPDRRNAAPASDADFSGCGGVEAALRIQEINSPLALE